MCAHEVNQLLAAVCGRRRLRWLRYVTLGGQSWILHEVYCRQMQSGSRECTTDELLHRQRVLTCQNVTGCLSAAQRANNARNQRFVAGDFCRGSCHGLQSLLQGTKPLRSAGPTAELQQPVDLVTGGRTRVS